jgi:hypothetical protein
LLSLLDLLVVNGPLGPLQMDRNTFCLHLEAV